MISKGLMGGVGYEGGGRVLGTEVGGRGSLAISILGCREVLAPANRGVEAR